MADMAAAGPKHDGHQAWAFAAMAALGMRVLLAASGTLPRLLESRIELATPASSLPRAREGVFLLYDLQQCPYSGSLFHGAPLLLPLLRPFVGGGTTGSSSSSESSVLTLFPFLVTDAVSAALLWLTASILLRRSQLYAAASPADREPLLRGEALLRNMPSGLALLYLWNPLSIMACLSGSGSCFEAPAVLLALLGGVLANPAVCGAGVALAAYLSPHHLLLLIPLGMMLWMGPEDVCAAAVQPTIAPASRVAGAGVATPPPSGGAQGARASPTAVRGLSPASSYAASDEQEEPEGEGYHGSSEHGSKRVPHAGLQSSPRGAPAVVCKVVLGGLGTPGLLLLLLSTAAAAATLLLLSNALLRGCCRSTAELQGGWAAAAWRLWEPPLVREWVAGSYGAVFAFTDLTPNIGLWWYFVTEIFDNFRPFFLFVLNCQYAVLAVPLAMRFPRQPLLLAVLHCCTSAMMRPYPCASDIALYMAVIPLLKTTVDHMRHLLLLLTGLMVISLLVPALWHMWIHSAVANANFFYAVTVALGVAHVVLISDLIGASIRRSRLLAGKPLVFPPPAPRQADKGPDLGPDERQIGKLMGKLSLS